MRVVTYTRILWTRWRLDCTEGWLEDTEHQLHADPLQIIATRIRANYLAAHISYLESQL